MLLLIAGHENSTSLIGNGVAMLLKLPDVRSELAQDPSRWAAAIEELMRLVSPNQFIRRQASEDVTLGDQTIRAGDARLLILAAANRDPDAFPDPDRFVFDRSNRQYVALGHGIHYCLGGPLARLEGRIALQTVFERWPSIRQTGELVYANNFNVRLLHSLPVAGCRILSATAKLRPQIGSRRWCRGASLQVMMMIFMVRRVRAAAVGLASVGSVLG